MLDEIGVRTTLATSCFHAGGVVESGVPNSVSGDAATGVVGVVGITRGDGGEPDGDDSALVGNFLGAGGNRGNGGVGGDENGGGADDGPRAASLSASVSSA